MANSKYEYVRKFEKTDTLLPSTWIVVRIDGRGFHQLAAKYKWRKPNDQRALDLMNLAATVVMDELPDIVMAYGQSDDFVLHQGCNLFGRRESKILTTVVSTFTASFVFHWSRHFPDSPLSGPLPSFDGRVVLYPNIEVLKEYFCWRQVDCHINNLFNTTFWALARKEGVDRRKAEQMLKGTTSADKNEILFSTFGINYNNEPEIFRKGSIVYRKIETKAQVVEFDGTTYDSDKQSRSVSRAQQRSSEKRMRGSLDIAHRDMINDKNFWQIVGL